MRVLALLLLLADLLVAAVATTACELLCCLDGSSIALAPLVVGDLQPLFASPEFAAAFPSLAPRGVLLAFGPAACIAVVASLLAAAAGRWQRVPGEVFALLAFASGALPYCVGALALRGNTVSHDAGPWLVWMLVGPLYGALLSIAWLGWAAWRKARVAVARPEGVPGAADAAAAR